MKDIPVITIDGPSGTGKGTVGQLTAQALGWHLLDSGALYRVLSLAAHRHDVALDNPDGLVVLAGHLDVQFLTAAIGEEPRVILEGDDVTTAIRTEVCGNDASIIGALPEVRQALVARQRAFRQMPGLVTDGRDMGTVIFQDAIMKFYLIASQEERIKRRFAQLTDRGQDVSEEEVALEIKARDKRDTERAVAPLKPAKDAIIIDTSESSISEVMAEIMRHVRKVIAA